MSVTNRYGESVGSIVGLRDFGKIKYTLGHFLNLFFYSFSVACNRFARIVLKRLVSPDR